MSDAAYPTPAGLPWSPARLEPALPGRRPPGTPRPLTTISFLPTLRPGQDPHPAPSSTPRPRRSPPHARRASGANFDFPQNSSGCDLEKIDSRFPRILPTLHPGHATTAAVAPESAGLIPPTLYRLPEGRSRLAGPEGPPSSTPKKAPGTLEKTPTRLPLWAGCFALGKSRRRTAYPQQIVTTRLLYCLQDRFAQLSRLQRI